MRSPKRSGSATTIVATPHSDRGGAPESHLRARGTLVDSVVRHAARETPALLTPGFCLYAVGGYGRGELFPASDIDLLLLFESERAARDSASLLSPFLQKLWDAGLRVSQSVRTPVECCELHEQNVELAVSLLDARLIDGDVAMSQRFEDRLSRFFHAQRQALVRGIERLTSARHARFGGSIYHLEPNIKEVPGGLRDLQVVRWLAALGTSRDDGAGLGQARDFLFRVRCQLHWEAQRDANVLSFDRQEMLAERESVAPAVWMRQYYRHARDVFRAAARTIEAAEGHSSSLFAQIRDRTSRFSNADFSVVRGRVYVREPARLSRTPEVALQLFELVARHGVQLSLDAEQRLSAHAAAIASWLNSAPGVWPVCKRILGLPHACLALREMHECGFLTVLFPELSGIDCLVVRDFFHRYTVDEHTLVGIRALTSLPEAGEAHLKPFAGLWAECSRRSALLLAVLFHDAGKADESAGHVDGSLRLANAAVERLGVPEEERSLVRFLIARHLDLSLAMQSRDLSDPVVLESLAAAIGTVENLRALTLLTFADISAVNPTLMTPWRASQLLHVFRAVHHELTRELDTDRIAAPSGEASPRAAFLDSFPKRYERTHSGGEIEQHVAMLDRARSRGVAVALDRTNGAWKLTVLASDRPSLFASVCGTLSAFGLSILRAEAFANRRHDVLDTFVFADPLRTLELNPEERDRLLATVERVVLGKVKAEDLLRNRPRPAPPSRGAHVAPVIVFDPDASVSATLVEIVAADRPGLLFDLAHAIAELGCSIEVVLVETAAHKAMDVFYLTRDGGKLDGETRDRLRHALLDACHQG
ncbi:MAG: nucleotidyltransferase domain-containing protein [Bryobacterales bacterium]|nr:nucleotidyltransferase domain-containing protein [Bryobacterales bacterium]